MARAAAITFNTALPVSQEEFILREQLVISGAASALGSRDEQVLDTVLGYGITPKLALFGVLPVVRAEVSTALGNETEAGIGDATIFARYEAFRQDGAGATLRVAPFLGVRLPSTTSNLLGDGSTDALLGVIATAATTKRTFDAQVAAELNSASNGVRAGHQVSLDLSLQYRAWPETVAQTTKGFVYAVIESSLVYQGRSRSGASSLDDTGGLQWFLIPGVQYVRQRWIADLAVKIPVATNLNGAALRTDYSVLASIRVNF